jgi:hypothetical protein
LERAYSQVKIFAEQTKQSGCVNPKGEELLSEAKAQLDSLKGSPKDFYKQIYKRITVNCWHINEHESEAMWKLYSDSGKGIAIQTSIKSLRGAIDGIDDNILIQLGVVKYLDFHDRNLNPHDCIVDGTFAPLLKRISYVHEKELRAYIVPTIKDKSAIISEPAPVIVNVGGCKKVSSLAEFVGNHRLWQFAKCMI